MNPHLFPRDHLFSGAELYRLYTPLYRWIVALAWQMGGAFEVGLALLVPPVLGIYLIGMFILLRRVSQNSWLALGLTVASAHYHGLTMGAEVWGVGGSSEMMSRTLFVPVVPFVMLMFLQIIEQPSWRQGAIFGLVMGLAANLHPVSAFHLLAVLLAWLVLLQAGNVRVWPTLGAIGLAALIGALPVTWNYLSNSGQPVGADVSFEAFSRIVAERYPMPFYPRTFTWPALNLEMTGSILEGLVWFYVVLTAFFAGVYLWGRRWPALVRWSWLAGGLITLMYAYMLTLFHTTWLFGLVGLYLIYCFWQGSYPKLTGQLIVLTALVVLYAFVGYYFLTLVWQTFEVWALTSLLIEYARAARFVYLPIYLLAGLAGAAYLKVLQAKFALQPRGQAAWAAFGLVILLILILFGPLAPFFANSLSVPARNLFSAHSLEIKPLSNPTDAELYGWVVQSTAPDALFYGCFGSETMTYFRRKTQRSISHNWKDLSFVAHHRATLEAAYKRFRDLETACQTFESAVAAAHALKSDYILASSQQAASFLNEACFANEKYAVFALNPNGCTSTKIAR
jgi:hypothetical protein